MRMLTDQVALVTGASSGIGEGLAMMLAELGAEVVLVARRPGELERVAAGITAAGGRAHAMPADLSDDEDLRTLLDAIGRETGPIGILVNNAASAATLRPVHEIGLAEWDAELSLNLRAPMALCTAVLPAMRQRRQGIIVNVCSGAGTRAIAGMGGYCVSKNALRVLTELIQMENQYLGIRAWAVSPGAVAAPLAAATAGWDQARQQDALTVADIVGLVRFLLSQHPRVQIGPQVAIQPTRDPFRAVQAAARAPDRALTARGSGPDHTQRGG
jgi:NADP-dependent 3-hydroxy acid dehydrogenase YdfG